MLKSALDNEVRTIQIIQERQGGNQEAHLQLNTRLMGIPLRRWLECRSDKNAGETTRQERHRVQREPTI